MIAPCRVFFAQNLTKTLECQPADRPQGIVSFRSLQFTTVNKILEQIGQAALKKIYAYDTSSPSFLSRRLHDGRLKYVGSLGGNGYFSIKYLGSTILCHQVILLINDMTPDAMQAEVDHIDNNRQNNRVENLRWVTRTENSWNRRSLNKAKSFQSMDKRFAYFDSIANKYRSEWKHPETGEKFFVGVFDTPDEASFYAKVSMAETLGAF